MRKTENFLRRALSMLMSICMLFSNMGGAFASMVSESTGPLYNYVDYEGQEINTSLDVTYLGTTDYLYTSGTNYTTTDDYQAWYWVDVSVSQWVKSISVDIDSSFALSGNPGISAYYGETADSIDMNAALSSNDGYSISATTTGTQTTLTLKNPADGNGWNMPNGYYRFLVGLSIPDDKLTDMINGDLTMTNTVSGLSVNGVSTNTSVSRAHTVSFTPVVTKTATQVTTWMPHQTYIRWELHYTNGIKLHNTVITDTISDGEFVTKWNEQINGENAIQAYEGDYLIAAGESFSADKKTVTFNVTGVNEESGYTDLRYKYSTDLTLVYFTKAMPHMQNNVTGVVSSYSVTPNGIAGTEISGKSNLYGHVKDVTVKLLRVENGADPVAIDHAGIGNDGIRMMMGYEDLSARTELKTVSATGETGVYTVTLNYADTAMQLLGSTSQNLSTDTIYGDGDSIYLNVNNNNNGQEISDLFVVDIEDNGGSAVVTMTNYINTIPVNVVFKRVDTASNAGETDAAYTGYGAPNLFAVYMDAEGNALSDVIQLTGTNTNNALTYNGQLVTSSDAQGSVKLLTLKNNQTFNSTEPYYSADKYNVYDGLTEETDNVEINMDTDGAITVYEDFNVYISDDGNGGVLIKLLNEIETVPVTVKLESYDETTKTTTPIDTVVDTNDNSAYVYVVMLDDDGNAMGGVAKVYRSGTTGTLTGELVVPAGSDGTINLLTLKEQKGYNAIYDANSYNHYYDGKLTENIASVDTDGDGEANMDEFFSVSSTRDNSGIVITLLNNRASALQGLVEAYNGGELEINTETGAFEEFDGGKYFNSMSPIGIAGSFHLVAFDTANLLAHTNGNVLANILNAENNFGTNGYEFELSYVVDYQTVHETSASSPDHILALGAGNELSVTADGNSLTVGVNGVRISKPKNVIIDQYEDKPFIDLAAVEAEVRSLSATLASNNENVGISEEFGESTKRLKLTSTSGAGYYNMSADTLMALGTDLRLDFTDQNKGSIVINVDCSGKSEINMPERALVNINGKDQGTAEVTTFENGKVIWNFVNLAEGTVINAKQMTGMIVAPGATVNLLANVNGTVIADVINVKAESHRTDFTGTVTPASGAFSAVKQVNGKTPSSDEKFWFVLEELGSDNTTWTEVQRTQNNGSKIEFENIVYNEAGLHTYRIRELNEGVADGYTISSEVYYMQVEVYSSSVLGNTALGKKYTFWKENTSLPSNEHFIFNNSKETVDLTLIKKDSEEEIYLQGAVFQLTKPDGSTVTVTTNDLGHASFSNLADGNYTLTELTAPAGYQLPSPNSWSFTKSGDSYSIGTYENASINGQEMTLLNIKEEKLTIIGQKTWNDNNNYHNNRPESITVVLLANGSEVARQTVTSANGWAWSFTELDVEDASGNDIVYTIQEIAVPGYTSQVSGYNIINTEETTTVSGEKKWEGDNAYASLTRPASVTIRVWNGSTQVATTQATAANNWQWSVSGLTKYQDGQLIVYTVTEDAVPGYTTSVSGTTVTNTLITTKVNGSKTWDDQNNLYGVRPDYITVTLNKTVNGTTTQVGTKQSGQSDNWSWSWIDLPTKELVNNVFYDVTYSVSEVAVTGYTTTQNGYNFTNTLKTVDLSGSKEWANDQDNKYSTRPESITINLLQNGGKIDSQTVTPDANGAWSWTFTDLPETDKYGNAYTYTFTEDQVNGYIASYDQVNGKITNTLQTTQLSGVKTWYDEDDKYGLRPSEIEISVKNGATVVATTTAKASDNWAWSVTGLPKIDKTTGSEISYTVEEVPANGYTAVISGTSISNHLDTVDLNGTKTWVGDEGFEDVTRPESITVKAMNGSTVVKTITVTPVNGDWSWTIEDLPKYDAEGNEVSYTVVEEPVIGYNDGAAVTAIYNEETASYDLTNTVITTQVAVTKVWQDENNKDSTRPTEIQVQLSSGDTAIGEAVTLTDGNWSYTWTNLPKLDAEGNEIQYAVDEVSVPEGYVKTVTGSNTSYTITNIYVFGTSAVLEAEKVLEGPATLTAGQFSFQLKDADGNVLQTKQNDATGHVTFDAIEYSAAGTYTYTISEVAGNVGGYTYDTAVYTATVTVTQDETTKQLSTAVSYTDLTADTVVPTFVNTYEVQPDSLSIPVVKNYAYDLGLSAPDITGKFTFVLTGSEGAPMPTTTSITNDGSAMSFGPIEFTAAGTYTYTVTESGTVPGVENDAEGSKSVTIVVTDDGVGNLHAAFAATSEQKVSFTNTYKVGETSAAIPVEKILAKSSDLTGPDITEAYTFTLAAVTAGAPMPEDGVYALKNPGEAGGTVTFGSIKFTEPGDYVYTVTESGTVAGVTNDTATKEVTIKVSDDSKGNLTASVVANGGNKVTFTNTYTAQPIEADIPVVKELKAAQEGLTLPTITGSFTFTLTAVTEGAPMPDDDTISNDGAAMSFENLTFDKAGVYEYTIAETGTVAGVTNDSSKTVIITVVDNKDGTLSATVSCNNAPTVVFTNTYDVEEAEQAIPVVKTLSVPEGLTGPETDVSFTFTLAAKNGAPMPADAVDGQSEITISLKDGSVEKSFGSITYTAPGTYTYTVTESGSADGVINDTAEKEVSVIVTDDGTGKLAAVVAFGDDDAEKVSYTNRYEASPDSVSIPVVKVLEAEGLTAPDITGKYTFKITSSEGAPMPAVKEYTYNGSEMTFGPIEFTAVGTYTYTISEDGTVPGITNDTELKQVTVTVTDDGKGHLTATSSLAESEKVTFTNTYKVGSVDVAIPAKKVFTVAEGQTGLDVTGLFTFTLAAHENTPDAPMPVDGVTVKTNPDSNGGMVTFGKIEYAKPGVYMYTVTESVSLSEEEIAAGITSKTLPGVTNDTQTTKTVTVTVTDHSDGTMSLVCSSTADAPVTFTNSYKAGPVEANIPVEKLLAAETGLNVPDITNAFTFTLTADVASNPMPTVVSQTNPNANGGSMTFGPISYSKVGTYTYTITESGEVDGVTTDAAKKVTITVTDNGDGTLTATVTPESGSKVTFTNEYTVEPTTATIPVKKTLTVPAGQTGTDITGKFTFTLAAVTAGAPMPADAVDGKAEITNSGATVSFGKITFTKPGTYQYTVTETGTVPGVTNDATATKDVTITVTDNGDGTLTAEVTGNEEGKVAFTNSYNAKPVQFSIPVVKSLSVADGLTAPDITGAYTFTITGSEPLPETKSFTNAEGVDMTFGPMEYTEIGTYTYTITESGVVAGVQNDSAKTVTVTVADDGKGNLYIADKTLADGESVVFTNTYTVGKAEISLSAEKKLQVGENLQGTDITGKFTFTLAAVGKAPLPVDNQLQKTNPAADGGVVSFGKIEYTEPGTYTYTITESGEAVGVVNDPVTVQTVTVTVVDNGDGTMTATASSEITPVVFTNTYVVESTSVSIPVEKMLDYADGLTPPEIDGQYTFEITSEDADAPMPEVKSLTYTEDGEGNAVAMSFGPISYDCEGVYTYTITESGTVAGVTNDTAKTVTVTVVDNGDGTLSATTDMTASKLIFTNTYDVEDTTVSFPVEKILSIPAGLTGPEDITGKFTFTLTRHEDNANAPLPAVTVLTNPAANGGAATFGKITYTEPGTYKYWVTETGTVAGVTNDATASKLVTVTVVDNSDGTMTATADSTVSAPLTFTNDYDVTDTTVSFPVEKILKVPAGLSAAGIKGAYTFTLTAAEGTPMPDVTSYQNPDEDGGVVTFGEITYTEPGQYIYTITETGTVAGVTNDASASKTVTVDVVDNGDGTMTATASSTDDEPLTFTNSYDTDDATASFPVVKKLEVVGGDDPDSIEGKFTFTLEAVTAGAPMPETTVLTNPDADGGKMTFGDFTFTAPGTYEYTVTETVTEGADVSGITNDATATKAVTITVADNGAGKLVATVSSTEDAPLTFTNTYDVDDTTASIPVEKLLNVPAGLTAGDVTGKFTFKLEAVTAGAPMPETTSLTNPDADGGEMSFGDITFTAPGTYEYTVTESGIVAGFTNDATATKEVTITVVDNGDGTMTATVDTETGDVLTFTNDYDVTETTASFPIEKKVMAASGLTAPDITGLFSFTLTAVDGAPMPDTIRYQNPDSDGGVVTFGPITYTAPGTYQYTISESVADGKTAGGFTLAGDETVTVTVVDNGDGTLTATASSTEDNILAFTNRYDVDETTASIPVKKQLSVLSGEGPDSIEGKFTFTLEAVTPGAPMPKTTSYTNPDADGGKVTFGTMTYTKPGTYNYKITETGSAAGVTNDVNNVRYASVVVTDNGDGTLTAVCNYTDESPVTFTNTYEVTDAKVSFPVKKILSVPAGLAAGDITGLFTFTLTAEEGTPMPETTSYTNPDEDGGMVTFGEIIYTEVGTYTYTITETGTVAGVSNDLTSAKTVTVEVVDNGKGQLVATASATEDEPLTFTNDYNVGETKISIPVKKTLSVPAGLTPGSIEGKFTFTLTAVTEGAPMPDETVLKNPDANGGVVTFGEIAYTEPGTYVYNVTETGSADGVTNDATATKQVTVTVVDNGDGTLTATATSTAAAPLTFTNDYTVKETTVSFPIGKVLEVPANLIGTDITGKFTFTLSAAEGTPMPEVTSYTNPDKDGGKVTFGDITYTAPGTYTYTVTESGSADGVVNDATASKTVTVTVVDNGDGTMTATASSTDESTLTFTNSYEVAPTKVSFPAKKVLSVAAGLNAPDITGKFTFTLAAVDDEPMPDVTEYTNPAANGGTVTFGDIEYTEPGTYYYTITESGTVAGITNDATATRTVTVTVVDNGDGTMTATADSTAASPLTFTNTYTVGKATASIPVEKTLSVPEGLTAGDITGKFTFTLAAVTEGAPMPETTSYTNPASNGGSVTFGVMTYEEPGTYEYTVTESGSFGGVTNDTEATKTVTVTVVDNGDGTMTATSSATSDAPVSFTNSYDVEDTTVSFPVEKILSVPAGLDAADITGKFTFTLTAEDGTPMPETTSYTNPSAEGGVVTFGDITYTMPGTYTYTVTETGTVDGITNDAQASKTVTVTVVDNGNGTMTATASSTSDAPLTFTNKYDVDSTTISFPVEKMLNVPEGLTAGDITGKFTFELTAADGTPMPTVTKLTNPDTDGGVMTFGKIEYTAPGTYVYTITETGSFGGVTNDAQASKTVTVTVVDNGAGKLVATATSTETSTLTFVNDYDVESVKASFPVEKILNVPEGLEPGSIAGKFTFTVTAAEGVPMPDVTSYQNPDADGGVVTFGEIEYTMPGTYVYTVTETGVVPGVTNDAVASKTVTVTVTDNGEGKLLASVSSTADEPLTFTNDYSVKETDVEFPVKKTLTVPEGLKANSIKGKFTFTLTASEGTPMPEDTSLTNPDADGGVMTFGKITYTEPGTYTYTVSETGSVPGVINDATTSKTVTVTVVDNGNGTMTATASSTEAAPLTFTNSYEVGSTTVNFPVKKTLSVPAGLEGGDIAGKFTFTLTAVNGTPMPDVTEYTNPDSDGGVVTFGPIKYSAPGTYSYKITETGSADGVTNDATSERYVTVTVVDNGDGSLTATADSTADSPLTFTNDYSVEPTKASFPVEKILSVPEGLTAGDITGKFTFTLTAADGIPMPEVTSYTNPDADGGKVTFGEIEYTMPGTYEYTITETGSFGGVTNDPEASKTVTVTVVDNGDGTMTATASSTDESTLAFTNSYDVDDVEASFPVEKILSVPEGLTAGDITGKFAFTLTAADGVPMPATTVYTNPDADGGVVTFGPMTYTAPGTYVYTVTETGSFGGVTNDAEAAKTVTVTVTDNGEGQLVATATSTDAAPLTFTNDYDVEATKISFPVEKILSVPEGLTANSIAGKFTFTVTAAEGVPMPAVTSYQNPDADGGVVTFGEIEYTEPGTYVYTITETGSADGVTNDAQAAKTVTVTVVDNGDGTLTATADSTTDKPLTFTNDYSVEPTKASFPVEKILSVPEGLTANSIAGKFTFTVTASEGVPMPEVTSYTNPDADGGVVTFGDIEYTAPGTYVYTITETGSADGVTNDATAAKTVTVTVVDNGDGTLTATADSTTDAPLTFTNDYSVEPTTVTFPAKKTLDVADGLTAPDITGQFTFTLTAEEGTPMPAVTSYTNPVRDGGVVTFGDIEYTEPGTYTYTITETGTVDGITNDPASKTVTVTVVDNGDGTLTATANSTAAAPVTFTNTYTVQPTSISFPVEKILDVPEGLTANSIAGKFTFTITAADGTPMPAVTSYTNPDADGGVVTFGEIEYTEPGTYVYTITETGSADGVTNDAQASKTVTVTVVDNSDGTMTATATSTTESPLTFTNDYSVEPTTASFPVEKILTVPEGLTPNSIEGKFTFTLAAVDGAPLPAQIAYTNPAANGGVVTFGEIEYTMPGTYEYTITETGEVDGITNDAQATKSVTVTVVDNGDGTLTATASSTEENTLTFTNEYSVEPTTASFPAKKALDMAEGLTPNSIAGKFTFTLTAEEGVPMPEVTSYQNPDADGGVVTFGDIEYTMPGTYVYTITETGSADGVTNDLESEKIVTVTVVDNGDGTLTATATSTEGEPLTFTNTYEVQPRPASFPIGKILDHAEGLTPNSIANLFTFTLTADEGVPMPEVTSFTNPDADGGKVSFGEITFTEPGTYVYTITETGSADGVTNDAEASKTVTIEVVDNGDGTMTATASSTEEKTTSFTNTYQVEPTTLSFPVEKVLLVDEGDTAPDITGAFTFELEAVDGAPLPDTIRYTNPAADGGTVTFGEITYTMPGTYTYKVTETGYVVGVINDATTTKTVTVTVVDNGDGTLTATADSTADAPLTFTNSNEVVDIKVTKVWDDDSNRDGKRPASIQVQLMANGQAEGAPVTLDESNSWTYTWAELPRYATATVDSQIAYTVAEIVDENTAAEYDITISYAWDDEANGDVTITNVHVPETVEITGSKSWDDIDNKYLKRPESVTIRLYADGVEVASKVVTEADNWSWTFTDLPKYKIGEVGQLVTYTISEDVVTGYITTIDEYNVLNTLNLVEFIKVDEQTGKPLVGAGFALYEGGAATAGTGAPVMTWTSDGTPKILAGLKVGQTYTIIETVTPSGYITMEPFVFTVELTDTPTTYRTFTVGNCHIYRFRKLDSETNGLVIGARLAVLQGETIIESWVTSSDNNGWYEIADDRLVPGVTYTLAELGVAWGYLYAEPINFVIDENDGMLIINGSKSNKAEIIMYDEPMPEITPTPEPTETSFSVTKRWEDKDNVLGLRPSSITVHLYRKLRTETEYPSMPFMTVNMTDNGKDVWKFTFNNLPRRSADGVLYDYMIREEVVEGYVVSYLNNGRTIVNTIPEEDYPPTPTPTLPYVTPTPTPIGRVPTGVQYIDGEWFYIDEYGIPLGGIPLTGDGTNFVLWGMAIGLPLLVAVLAAVEIRRRKKLLAAAEQDEEVEDPEA